MEENANPEPNEMDHDDLSESEIERLGENMVMRHREMNNAWPQLFFVLASLPFFLIGVLCLLMMLFEPLCGVVAIIGLAIGSIFAYMAYAQGQACQAAGRECSFFCNEIEKRSHPRSLHHVLTLRTSFPVSHGRNLDPLLLRILAKTERDEWQRLDRRSRVRLREGLKRDFIDSTPQWIERPLAILDLFERVGDIDSLPTVRKLLKSEAPVLREHAVNCVAALEAMQTDERRRRELLRPSEASFTRENLLRPHTENRNKGEERATLLRADLASEAKPETKFSPEVETEIRQKE